MREDRELKIGDRVRIIIDSYYNGQFSKGDVVYVVDKITDTFGDGVCPYYLSKYKQRKMGNCFGPYRSSYEYVPNKILVGGLI